MEDLFKALMGGSAPDPAAAGTQGNSLADLLQGLLGGTGGAGSASAPGWQPPSESGAATGAGGLGELLEAILGGGQSSSGLSPSPQSGGLGDILGAMLGGGSPSAGSDPFVSGLVQMLSDKLGLPPQIGQVVVMFVLSKLLGRAQQGSGPAPRPSAGDEPAGMDLDGLLDTVGRGKSLSLADVRSTGMAEELSQQTGLDPATAAASLQEVLNALGQQGFGQGPSPSAAKPQSSGLDSLLDTW